MCNLKSCKPCHLFFQFRGKEEVYFNKNIFRQILQICKVTLMHGKLDLWDPLSEEGDMGEMVLILVFVCIPSTQGWRSGCSDFAEDLHFLLHRETMQCNSEAGVVSDV